MSRWRSVGVVVAACALLGGCGLFSGDEPGPSDTKSAETSDPNARDGVASATLSTEILDAAGQAEEVSPLATGTGSLRGGESLTIDVVSVQRTSDATLVTMRISGDDGALGSAFRGQGETGLNFARTLFLVDREVTKTRYRPLQFSDYRAACVCPYFPFNNGSQPQTVTALYPELPESVTTVALDANEFLTVDDLPITG